MLHYSLPSLILTLILLFLTGCVGTPPSRVATVEDDLRNAAEELATQGDFFAAAQLYLSRSKTAPAEQKDRLRLDAAEYLARGQLWEQLTTLLRGMDAESLDPEAKTDYRLLQIELTLAEQQVNQALADLQAIQNPELHRDQGRKYYRLRARAYVMAGNPLESARQLVWLDGLLTDPDEQKTNQLGIWEQLSSLSDLALQQLNTTPPPDTLSGWMELALITRQTIGDPGSWSSKLEDWRARFPDHPAESYWLPEILARAGQVGPRASQIAVLLPLSGRAADAASIIRDGIMTAYYSDQQWHPELRFYDTGGDSELLWSVYQEAVQNGAEIVIGPLLKNNIQQLAQSGFLSVPVLALNQVDSEIYPDLPLYQFGLSPEDEAAQTAERIIAEGHQQVVALVPDSSWGQRVYNAFQDRLVQLDGEVLEVASYPPASADFGTPIKSLLNLTASKQRHQALERLFGSKLIYEPRRRQDVEAVLLLGFPKQARLLKPQLRFHHAGDLPVYSTSHVFTGTVDTVLDRDMDGIEFCDIPWILNPRQNWEEEQTAISSLWASRSQRHQRLFALGIDAYRVLPWLDTLGTPGFGYFQGATGTLTLDHDKQLHRRLQWARFRRGAPELLEFSENTLPYSVAPDTGIDRTDSTPSTEGRDESETHRRSRRNDGLPFSEATGTEPAGSQLPMPTR